MAVALTHLGAVAFLQGDFETAENRYRQSLAIYRDIDDQGGLVTALDGLGRALCARRQLQTAAQYLHDALRIATTAQFNALRLSLMTSIGQLLLQTGRQEPGIQALLFVRQHPATIHEARDHAQRLLESYHDRISLDIAGRGQVNDLEILTMRLQAELAALETQRDAGSPTGRAEQPSAQPLIEPLTPRERELLQLLATGLSYQEIAEQLRIAVGSVKSHSHNIYAKLGVRNRVQAILRAVELGLL
jgi:DNA-binding CsgD family transcriptional regulator